MILREEVLMLTWHEDSEKRSAFLTPEAIYYDILPVKRIDVKTGDVTE